MPESAPPSALYNAVLTAFQEQRWHWRPVAGMEVIEADFEAHHAKVPLHVQVYGEAQLAVVVANVTLDVPASHRLVVAELLMRTNQELNVGNFEMIWDSREVMFRVTNLFSPNRYDERILASMVHAAIAEVDRLTPFLGEVCRTPTGKLPLLNVRELMGRDELLPPAPPEPSESAA